MNNGTIFDSVLTVPQVAQLLGCAERTVEDLARSGELPGSKFGDGGWRFLDSALRERLHTKSLEEAERRRLAPGVSRVLVVATPPPAPSRRAKIPDLSGLCRAAGVPA